MLLYSHLDILGGFILNWHSLNEVPGKRSTQEQGDTRARAWLHAHNADLHEAS